MQTISKTPSTSKSPSAQRLSGLIASKYTSLHLMGKQGAFVIWAAICAPVEIFKGFQNIVVVIPENHSAMTAGKGAAIPFAERAENLGYSMDLCSYARIDIGAEIGTENTNLINGLPKPDLLLSDTNNCSLLVKWFDVYRREFNVPHFILDVPFCYEPQQPKDTEYIIQQFKKLIALVEHLTGQAFDIEKCRSAVALTDLANRYWKEFLG
nr:2-hydroxyacyl-CoA dehydratase family protein [Candidatus Sigynarchaeota archaeon]